ncbi:hypothetical protein [Bradyrhizobium murdochi]|uniref:hypothetical protein n=1 Tax=Bradyrhizobium murdochi TaxID=1038859 RepID=UPI00047FED69|nr:hypothetical protein [Bradyrhizobium murdochi]
MRLDQRRDRLSGELHGPMIIAMIAVRMVQPAVYEIVDVIAVRYRFVSAIWTVFVRATDFRRALHRICGVDRDRVLIHVILVHVMEMAIMKVIHMAVVANRGVPAARTMLVGVVVVMLLGAFGHCGYSLRLNCRSIPHSTAN